MAGPTIYRMYVDDSGEKEYGPNASRYFIYAGVVVAAAHEPALNRKIAELKVGCFKTSDVELKSNWLRNPGERAKHYLGPFGLTEERLARFTDDLYEWLAEMAAAFGAAAVDKVQMQAKYGAGAWHPSATAYQFLLQRYEKHLCRVEAADSHGEARGQVTVDNMTGSSPKQNQWRDLLRAQHHRLLKDGCNITKMRFAHVAPDVRFADSRGFHLLQVADLLAYNVFRQFRDHGDVWDDPKAKTMPVYGPLKPLLPRFMCAPDGQWQGWGMVKWPSQRPGRWYLMGEEQSQEKSRGT